MKKRRVPVAANLDVHCTWATCDGVFCHDMYVVLVSRLAAWSGHMVSQVVNGHRL